MHGCELRRDFRLRWAKFRMGSRPPAKPCRVRQSSKHKDITFLHKLGTLGQIFERIPHFYKHISNDMIKPMLLTILDYKWIEDKKKSQEKTAQSSKTPKLKDSTRMTAGRDGTGRSEWCEWEKMPSIRFYSWRGKRRGETQSRLFSTNRHWKMAAVP